MPLNFVCFSKTISYGNFKLILNFLIHSVLEKLDGNETRVLTGYDRYVSHIICLVRYLLHFNPTLLEFCSVF